MVLFQCCSSSSKTTAPLQKTNFCFQMLSSRCYKNSLEIKAWLRGTASLVKKAGRCLMSRKITSCDVHDVITRQQDISPDVNFYFEPERRLATMNLTNWFVLIVKISLLRNCINYGRLYKQKGIYSSKNF